MTVEYKMRWGKDNEKRVVTNIAEVLAAIVIKSVYKQEVK